MPLAPDSGATDAGTEVPADLTYHEHIRPILAENCVSCHTAGGIAPFTLRNYAEVTEVGQRIAEVTRDRVMPPYVVDATGSCNEYKNARILEQREIDMIGAWVAAGMPEGDASIPAPPEAVYPTLDEVSSTLDIGVEYLPSTAVDDDYRCFVVETDFTDRQFLTGYDVRPGNAEVVHHLLVYAPITEGEADMARAREAADERPGYTCYGDAGVIALPVVVWAPGAGSTSFPEGTGIEIDGSLPLIVQVHYNLLANDDRPDRSLVDLQLASSVENQAWMGMIADFRLSLPPRMPEVVASADTNFQFAPNVPFRVWGAFPHMHTLGRQLRVEATNAERTCLVDVPNWDFNWQGGFFYETPIDIPVGMPLNISCTYDTMERSETTYWGDGTQDEMCLSFFYVTEN